MVSVGTNQTCKQQVQNSPNLESSRYFLDLNLNSRIDSFYHKILYAPNEESIEMVSHRDHGYNQLSAHFCDLQQQKSTSGLYDGSICTDRTNCTEFFCAVCPVCTDRSIV